MFQYRTGTVSIPVNLTSVDDLYGIHGESLSLFMLSVSFALVALVN